MRKILLSVFLLVVGLIFSSQLYALPVLSYGDNLLEYRNKETVFTADGLEKNFQADPSSYQFSVGDIFVGILDLQTITNIAGGNPTFESTSAARVSGVFAQEVAFIDTTTGFIGLKAASRSDFTTLGGVSFNTGLVGDEMMSLYYRTINTSFYVGSGSIEGDIARSTDGIKWMTLGYDDGAGAFNDGDEDGYAYTIGTLGLPVANFTAQSWAGLNVLYSAVPGAIFPGANDPNESISQIWLGPNFLTDAYMTSHIEGDNAWEDGGYNATPWVFTSNDPAHINVVPEPATMTLFGIGLLGFAGLLRRKQN